MNCSDDYRDAATQARAARFEAALREIAACNGATVKFTRYREVTDIARAALSERGDTKK